MRKTKQVIEAETVECSIKQTKLTVIEPISCKLSGSMKAAVRITIEEVKN